MSARKPAAKRQNAITKDYGAVSAAGEAPRTPPGLCGAARRAWDQYWSDPVSSVVRASDHCVVVRWVRNVDRLHRLATLADSSPTVAGSKGQTRIHPMYALMGRLEASVRDDERQLGIGPAARLKLGIVVTESAKSLVELNAESDDDEGDEWLGSLAVLGDHRPDPGE